MAWVKNHRVTPEYGPILPSARGFYSQAMEIAVGKGLFNGLLLLIGVLILSDQLIKNAILRYNVNVIVNQNLQIIPSLNKQAAGSIPIPQSIIIIASLAVIALLIRWLVNPRQPVRPRLALSLIIAGGLSNLIDRIFYGATIDFFAIYALQINLADIYIAFGGIIILIAILRRPRQNSESSLQA